MCFAICKLEPNQTQMIGCCVCSQSMRLNGTSHVLATASMSGEHKVCLWCCVCLSVSQSASREGEFRESDDCSLLLFRWLALTPQAPSG